MSSPFIAETENPRYGPFGPFSRRGTILVKIGRISGSLAILFGLYGAKAFRKPLQDEKKMTNYYKFLDIIREKL